MNIALTTFQKVPIWGFADDNSFELMDGDEALYRDSRGIGEDPFSFSRSTVKVQGHKG